MYYCKRVENAALVASIGVGQELVLVRLLPSHVRTTQHQAREEMQLKFPIPCSQTPLGTAKPDVGQP